MSAGTDDTSRKRRNAKWAAGQAYDTLGVIWRHEAELRRLVERYKDEPAFQSRVRALGLCTEIEKHISKRGK